MRKKFEQKVELQLKNKFKDIAAEAANLQKNKLEHRSKINNIANEAALKAAKRLANIGKTTFDDNLKKQGIEQINKIRYKKYVKTEGKYNIVIIRSQDVNKYNAAITDYRIEGDPQIDNLAEIINELVKTMVMGLPENVRVKLSYYIPSVGASSMRETKLLSITNARDALYENIIYLVEYLEHKITDVVFSLLRVVLPAGNRNTPNKIVNAVKTKSVINLTNTDTLCCSRALLLSLSRNCFETFSDLFKGKLTTDEINSINKGRRLHNYTKINEGVFSASEIKYLRESDKTLMTVLAKSFHRIYSIPIRETGNDLSDISYIADKIKMQISVFRIDRKLIYKVGDYRVRADILLDNNHYNPIVNIKSFLCEAQTTK